MRKSIGLVLISFSCGVFGGWLFNSRVSDQKMVAMNSLLGGVVKTLTSDLLVRRTSYGRSDVIDLRVSLAQISLSLLGDDLDLERLTADGFQGVCVLVNNADEIFPVSMDEAPGGEVFPLLRRRLKDYSDAVDIESKRRLKRLAGGGGCVSGVGG